MRNAVAPTQSLCDVWLTRCKNKAGNSSVNSQRASGRPASCVLSLTQTTRSIYRSENSSETDSCRCVPRVSEDIFEQRPKLILPSLKKACAFHPTVTETHSVKSLRCVAGQIDGHPLRCLRSKMQRCAPHNDKKQTVCLAELLRNTGKKGGTSKLHN